jgi:uncharacterized membrane protein YfcA
MEKNEFNLVKEFLNDRFKAPLSSVSFVLYFIFVILLVGLAGSFLSSFDSINFNGSVNFKTVAMSLVGYGVVLLSSSSIELIFIRLNSDEKEKFRTIKKAISMIGVVLIILSLFLSLLVYSLPNEILKFSISLILCFIALYFWWVTNSKTLIVLNDIPPAPTTSETTGGDENVELTGVVPVEYKA